MADPKALGQADTSASFSAPTVWAENDIQIGYPNLLYKHTD
jgi:hypothetical protein